MRIVIQVLPTKEDASILIEMISASGELKEGTQVSATRNVVTTWVDTDEEDEVIVVVPRNIPHAIEASDVATRTDGFK